MATVTTKPSLTIKRRFKAPPAKVFAAWTDPEKLKHWMGGREIASVTAQADVRVGGRYRIVMQKAGDGEQHDVSGVYREVIPDEKLVFTWAWKSTPERESVVTITFKADNGGTLIRSASISGSSGAAPAPPPAIDAPFTRMSRASILTPSGPR